MNVFEQRGDTDTDEDMGGSENSEIFDNLRSSFTVQTESQEFNYHEILMINKAHLLQMQIEFPLEFKEFF